MKIKRAIFINEKTKSDLQKSFCFAKVAGYFHTYYNFRC